MNDWDWRPERNLGIWRCGAGWLRALAAGVPCVTVGLLLVLLLVVSNTLSLSRGTLFELPVGDFTDVEGTRLVALVAPVARETVVFFDDSRYQLEDASSLRNFSEALSARVERLSEKSMLVLADRRVSAGDLSSLVSVVRKAGVKRILVAGKHTEADE